MKNLVTITMILLVIFLSFSIPSFIAMAPETITSEVSLVPSTDWIRLTDHSQGADMSTWHPDGSEIVYITWDENPLATLYKMNADGSNHTSLAVERVGYPHISPDGSKIACMSFSQIVIMNYNGTDYHPIYGVYSGSGGPGGCGEPRWSPDSNKLAIIEHTSQYDRHIITITPNGSDPTPLTDSDETIHYPRWSPDGTKITFGWERDIWIMDSDGQNKHRISYFNDAGLPVWSPDGSSIYFCRYYGVSRADAHIYRINIDGTNVVQLTNSTGEWYPAISPDGKWMTFTHTPTGDENDRNIYKLELPPPVLPAIVNINPETLNLKSKGRWITSYVELPESYDINDINTFSIMLNDTIQAETYPQLIGDQDSDNIPDLMIKFSRDEVILLILSTIDPSEYEHQKAPHIIQRTLKLTGKLADGTSFTGYDTIRVIFKHALVT
jgi:dipeptidyl aminopeptidase/acylaminoacyl peptidase